MKKKVDDKILKLKEKGKKKKGIKEEEDGIQN